MTSDSVEVNHQLTVVKSINVKRRRFKIRRLKYTCQTKSSRSSSPDNKKELSVNGEAKPNECSAEISLSLDNVVLSSFQDEKLVSLSYGTVALKGRRKEMEDAARVERGFVKRGGEDYDFFGVYDGHGGWRVAERCKERLHEVVAETVGMEMEWERVMERSFERMDEEVGMDRMIGSTAVVAVVGKEEVVVANCGDSRAVICRNGVAVPLSIDHKPDRPDELERIEGAGGRVINWNGQRVLGVLATSRSIGDEYLKPFIISKPEVNVIKRIENDEFLILASDGLWDVISNEVACQVGRKCLSGRMRRRSKEGVTFESRAAEAAAVLADLALARGSQDNITVIVVELNNK